MWPSLVAQMVKNLPAMQETRVWFPGSGGSPGEGNGHSSILAWRIPWAEEPGGLQSMGLQRIEHDWAEQSLPEGTSSSTEVINSAPCSYPTLCSFVTIVTSTETIFAYVFFYYFLWSFKGRLCVIFAYRVSTLLGSIDSQMLVEWVQGVFRGLWEN